MESPQEDGSLLDRGRPEESKKNRRRKHEARNFGCSTSPSLYLRRWFLAGLTILFTLFVIALEILNYFSNRDQGFVSADEGMHYLWTYGPTIILTVAAAVWSQVEYRIQLSAPWMALARKPLSAEQNLHLNYVTPWSGPSLFRSLSARDFPVSLAILNSLLLKLLIIVSTGLLALENKERSHDTEFRMVDEFNFSLGSTNAFNSRVALWAITEGGVPYPPGMTSEHATSSFQIASFGSEASDRSVTYSANVPVFTVAQNCTSFSWTFETRIKESFNFSMADIIPPSDVDQLSHFCVTRSDGQSSHPYRIPGTNTYKVYEPLLVSHLEQFDTFVGSFLFLNPDCDHDMKHTIAPEDDRLHTFMSYTEDRPENVSTVSAVLCHPAYSLTKRQVRTTSEGNVLDVSETSTEAMALGISQTKLTFDLFELGSLDTNNAAIGKWDALMRLVSPQSDSRAFSNTTILSNAFQNTFKIASLLAAKNSKTVAVKGNQTVSGFTTYATARLVTTQIALRLMEALLVAMSLIALALCLYNFDLVPNNPSSLKHIAMVLSMNQELPHGGCGKSHELGPQATQPPDWWRPMAATKMYRIILIITTLLIFVAVEVLYQVSKKNAGLAEVNTEGYTRYFWLFIPSVCMATLGLAYGAADTAARTLYPFVELSTGRGGTQSTMEFDPRTLTALVALPQILYRRRFTLSAVVSTSILGSLLTIAASGLFLAKPLASGTQGITLDLATWFDLRPGPKPYMHKWRYYEEEGIPMGDLTLLDRAIQFNNLSFPPGTYDRLAFALPDISHLSSNSNTITARLPAVELQANCTPHQFWDSMELNEVLEFPIEIEPPPGCTPANESYKDENIVGTLFDELTLNTGLTPPNQGYFGFVVGNMWWGGHFENQYTICSDDTIHIFLFYGNRIAKKAYNNTILHCLPFVQAIEVEATFSLPSLAVDDTKSPPKVVGQPTPWHSKIGYENSILLPLVIETNPTNYDRFFTALTQGRSGAPMEDLIGRDRVDLMIEHVDTTFGQLAAQALYFQFRDSMDNITAGMVEGDGRPLPPRTVRATVNIPAAEGRGRLIQTEMSSRLLEVLLLCLVICTGVSLVLERRNGVDTGRILPVDPGSIAARMSLLSGSELVKRLRRDGESTFEGARFRLGWWEGRGRSGGEDGSEEDQAGGNKEGGPGRWYGIDIMRTDC